MRVLITGGAGYIGTELCHALTQLPEVREIVLYDSLSRGNYNLFLSSPKLDRDKVHFVKGELLDTRSLGRELAQSDVVFHLAAKVSTPFADHNPHEFDQVNHWGTAELCYLVENSPVQRFLYLSSASVYGASEEESDIHTPPNPRTFYGISKSRGEDHVQRLIGSHVQTYIFRCGNVYGYSKSMRFDSVINKFLFEANFSNRIRIMGDGNQYRSFIHIDRLSQFLATMSGADLKPEVYNLVESNFSINELVDALRELYPTLEMVFVSQNMPMRNLKVQRDERLQHLQPSNSIHLVNDLRAFRESLSF